LERASSEFFLQCGEVSPAKVGTGKVKSLLPTIRQPAL
jgi:hypothetical protein